MKKFAYLLLTVVLLATMLTVFAVPASAEGEVSKSENATWLVDEGYDHVWYELTENDTVLPDGKTGRTLTIGGTGDMPGYNANTPTLDKRPWKDYIETITTAIIDSGVTNIGDNAFNGCTNLTSVTIPSSVTNIGDLAFNGCTNLTSVTIPSSVTRICQSAFRGCASLQSVIIPYGVTDIGESAFFGCASLQSVTIPSSVTRIGDSAFRDCKSLQSVTIPYGVTSIVGSAFYGCASLQSVTISYGVTSIEDDAFHGCASLQSVTIPPSVTRIKSNAFADCTSLQSVTIPYGVTSIGMSAFMSCASLQSVTIPSSVTSIDGSAFISCRKLASVTVKTSTPPTLGKNAFDNTADDLAIYVPCGSVEDYKGATNWSGKSGQIKEAYIVDDQPGKNGTIMLDKDCFPKETYTEPNETVTVTVMPADGYRLKADSLLVTYKDENGAEKTADLTQDETDPTKYSFTMLPANVTVKAAFEEITDESEPAPTATVFSEGNIWIIIAVAVVVIGLGGAAALFIVKKKKKPAASDGESNK